MLQFDAEDQDVQYVNCAVCENAIFGGKWFSRIRHGNIMVALCCPLCTETFEKDPKPYVRRIQTYDQMRLRSNEGL